MNRNYLTRTMLASILAVSALPGLAFAVDVAPAPVAAPEAATPQAAAAKLLTLNEIEGQLGALGIRVKEMEVKDKVLEVEGLDAQNREIDLLVDRRSGEILSRKYDK